MKRIFMILSVSLFLVSQTVSVYGAAYEYDDSDRVTKVIYEDGSSVSYTYDANGNMTEMERLDEDKEQSTERLEEPDGKPSRANAQGDGAGANGRDVDFSKVDAGYGAGDSVTSGEDILQKVQSGVADETDVRDKISGTGKQNELLDEEKGIGETSEAETKAAANKTMNFMFAVIASGVMGGIVLQKIKSKKHTKEKAGNKAQGDKNEGNDME